MLVGEQSHDGRLDDRHERHVGVGGYGDRAQQFGGQHRGEVDGRGTVRTADDADRTALFGRESDRIGAEERHEDADLRRSAQQETLGIGDQRTEIGHGAYAQKDQAGVDAQLDAQVKVVQQARLRDEDVPMDMPSGKELGVVEIGAGQVRQQHAECDGQQQQRLELMPDSQIEQEEGDADHHDVSPTHGAEKTGQTGRFAESDQALPDEVGT